MQIMSLQTINDPETLRIKLSGKQILGLVIAVFACGAYMTSLHFQVSSLKDEVLNLNEQVTQIKGSVDNLATLKYDVQMLRDRLPRHGVLTPP